MNKDLYIALLEEHVDDLSTAMKIDTVLSLRKTEKIRSLKSELASVSDWNKAQDELISKIADTAMDYQDDINDLQYEWAKDHDKVIKQHDADCALSDMTLQEFERDIESLTEERDRFRRIIRELKKENCSMGMEFEKLKKQNETLKNQNENLIEDLETSRKRLGTEVR